MRFILLGCGLLTLLGWGADLPSAPVAGVPNFQAVDERVFRGGQPTGEGLRSLARLGVKTVVDLRAEGPRSRRERQDAEAAGMRYVSIPLNAMSASDPSRVEQVLAWVGAAESLGGPAFIHCWRGKDRTGVAIACYRMTRYGWTADQALEEARRHGLSRFEPGMERFIRRYRAKR